MKRLLIMLLSIFLLAGCSDEKREEVKRIVITGGEQNQNLYADEISGKSEVTFVTAGAWTSSIMESVPVKSDSIVVPDWISIDPAEGSVGGKYTINITLLTNYTGVKRSVTITIICGTDKIVITVTQEATTKEGKEPGEPKPVLKRVKKINGKSVVYGATIYEIENITQFGDDPYITKPYDGKIWGYVASLGSTGLKDWSCMYDYNKEGVFNLSKVTAIFSIQNESFQRVTECGWSGDKMTYIRGDQQLVGREGYLRTDLEYGTTEYTLGNIDINWLLAGYEYYVGLPVAALSVKNIHHNKLLVKKVQKEELGDGKYNATITYRYVFDTDGYITQIYHTTTLYDFEQDKLIYEFEY